VNRFNELLFRSCNFKRIELQRRLRPGIKLYETLKPHGHQWRAGVALLTPGSCGRHTVYWILTWRITCLFAANWCASNCRTVRQNFISSGREYDEQCRSHTDGLFGHIGTFSWFRDWDDLVLSDEKGTQMTSKFFAQLLVHLAFGHFDFGQFGVQFKTRFRWELRI